MGRCDRVIRIGANQIQIAPKQLKSVGIKARLRLLLQGLKFRPPVLLILPVKSFPTLGPLSTVNPESQTPVIASCGATWPGRFVKT